MRESPRTRAKGAPSRLPLRAGRCAGSASCRRDRRDASRCRASRARRCSDAASCVVEPGEERRRLRVVETVARDQRRRGARCRCRSRCARRALPRVIGERGLDRVTRRTAHRPRAERVGAARRRSGAAASTKPARMPASPKNLPTERSTTRPSRSVSLASDAPGIGIGEGFVDDQRAAARAQLRVPAQQRRRARCARPSDCSDSRRSRDRVRRASRARDTSSGTTRCPARSNAGAYSPYVSGATPAIARRNSAGNARIAAWLPATGSTRAARAVVARGAVGETVVVFGQTAPRVGGHRRHRIAVRIDAGREIEPVVERNRDSGARLRADCRRARIGIGVRCQPCAPTLMKARSASSTISTASHRNVVRSTSLNAADDVRWHSRHARSRASGAIPACRYRPPGRRSARSGCPRPTPSPAPRSGCPTSGACVAPAVPRGARVAEQRVARGREARGNRS